MERAEALNLFSELASLWHCAVHLLRTYNHVKVFECKSEQFWRAENNRNSGPAYSKDEIKLKNKSSLGRVYYYITLSLKRYWMYIHDSSGNEYKRDVLAVDNIMIHETRRKKPSRVRVHRYYTHNLWF